MRPRRLLSLAAATALTATTLLTAPAQATPAVLAGDLASTIALNNCSASLVRFPTSQASDRAMMLTNGHCYEGGFPSAGQVLTDRVSTRSGTLLNASGGSLGTVRADRLIYATMTSTDVALYRLNESFSSIQSRTGAAPLTIRASKPADGTAMFIPSGYWKRVWECSIQGFVYELRESQWTFKDSIRYRKPCETIGGTSGSPVVDSAARDVIGINNTKNENGQRCTLNNPCEVDQNGTITVDPGRSYGQQTWWFTTCVGASNTLDLTKPGCLLPGASSDPGPGPNLLKNPGFESGAVDWTGTTGVITDNTGRPARTGTWKAWLGGNGTTSTEQIRQSVAIPSTATAPKLSFWLRTDTSESGSTVYDRLRIQVIDGATTTTLATFTNVGTNSTYTQKTYDLTAYKGKTVSVRFSMTEDVSLQTSFVVDDTAVTTG
jgi:Trypsin-like peptidase domain